MPQCPQGQQRDSGGDYFLNRFGIYTIFFTLVNTMVTTGTINYSMKFLLQQEIGLLYV